MLLALRWLSLKGRYYFALGNKERAAGRLESAASAFEQAESAFATDFGPRHPFVAAALISRAECYARLGWYAEACREYNRALRLVRIASGAAHPKALEIE